MVGDPNARFLHPEESTNAKLIAHLLTEALAERDLDDDQRLSLVEFEQGLWNELKPWDTTRSYHYDYEQVCVRVCVAVIERLRSRWRLHSPPLPSACAWCRWGHVNAPRRPQSEDDTSRPKVRGYPRPRVRVNEQRNGLGVFFCPPLNPLSTLSLITRFLNGNTVRNFPPHGQLSAAQGNLTSCLNLTLPY
jgi:hypothetical protein